MSTAAPVPDAIAGRRRSVAVDRFRRRRTALLVAVAGAAGATGVWWMLTGPPVAIRSLQIKGYTRSDAPVLARYAQRAVSQGTMLSLPTGQVRRALARFPWVADVSLERDWPFGVTLVVHQARPAALAVAASGGPAALVSSDGRILGLARGERGASALPRVVVSALPSRLGQDLATPEDRAAAEIAADLRLPGQRLDRVTVRQGGIEADLTSGLQLRFGPADRIVAKLAALRIVFPRLHPDERRAGAYLDLSDPHSPAAGSVAAAAASRPATSRPSGTAPASSTAAHAASAGGTAPRPAASATVSGASGTSGSARASTAASSAAGTGSGSTGVAATAGAGASRAGAPGSAVSRPGSAGAIPPPPDASSGAGGAGATAPSAGIRSSVPPPPPGA